MSSQDRWSRRADVWRAGSLEPGDDSSSIEQPTEANPIPLARISGFASRSSSGTVLDQNAHEIDLYRRDLEILQLTDQKLEIQQQFLAWQEEAERERSGLSNKAQQLETALALKAGLLEQRDRDIAGLVDRIETLETEIGSYDEKLDTLSSRDSEESDRQRKRLQEVKAEWQQERDIAVEWQSKHDALAKQASEFETQKSELEDQLGENEARIEALTEAQKSSQDDAVAQINELQEALVIAGEAQRAGKLERQALAEKLSGLESRLSSQESRLSARKQRLVQTLRVTKDRDDLVKSLRRELRTAQEYRSEVVTELAQVKGRGGELERLQKELKEAQAVRENAEPQMMQLREELKKRKAELRDQAGHSGVLEADLKSIAQAQEATVKQVALLETRLKEEAERADELESSATSLKDQLKAASAKAVALAFEETTLREQLDARDGEAKILTSDLKDARAEIESLTKSRTDADRDAGQRETAIADIKDALAKTQKEHQGLIDAYGSTTQTLEEREVAFTALQESVEALKVEKDNFQKHIEAVEIERDAAREDAEQHAKSLASQQSVITELRDVLAKEHQEREDASRDNESQRVALLKAGSDIEEATLRLTEAAEQKANISEELASVRVKLETLETGASQQGDLVAERDNDIMSLRDLLAEARRERQKAVKEIDRRQQELEAKEVALSEAEESLVGLRELHAETLKTANARIADLETRERELVESKQRAEEALKGGEEHNEAIAKNWKLVKRRFRN